MAAQFPRTVVLLALLSCGPLSTPPAAAADPCLKLPASALQSPEVSTRIAAAACEEHRLWYRPLIEADGRIGAMRVREAERSRLANGQPAWRRVVEYWRDSGLLWRAGAGDCAYGDLPMPSCRAFVVDTPWSAAFVSWVMRRAGLPGFTASARHLDYVRAAWTRPARDPYRLASPLDTAPAVGDLLCYVRAQARVLGHRGLVDRLDGGAGLPMHCDIVVAAGDGMAWLVGGNVQQAVTLRMLRLDGDGRFADLPLRGAGDPPCSPDAPGQCNLNRQDWAALLKLEATTPASLLAGNP